MTSLHSSVGSKSTDPQLPCGSGGGRILRPDGTSSFFFGCARGGLGLGADEGSSARAFRSSWISRLRPSFPPPPRPHLPPLPAEPAGSLQVWGTASTRESRTREPEAGQVQWGRAVAEDEASTGHRRLVTGFGPFQVRPEGPRLLSGGGHGHRWRPEGRHGTPAVAGAPDRRSSCESYLRDGCFPIFQRIAGIGEVCRAQQAAGKDGEGRGGGVAGEGTALCFPQNEEIGEAAAAAARALLKHG